MPRPKNPNSLPIAQTPAEAIELGYVNGNKDQTFSVSDIATNAKASEELQTRIDAAEVLLQEKAELNSKVQKLREAVTILSETGSGNREQVAWVRFYLPRKQRKGSADMSLVSGGNGDEDE